MTLPGNRTLQKLDVSHKGLTAASMHVLACGVVERGGLDTLILSQNEIGNAGAEALAPAMPLIREASLFWQPCFVSLFVHMVASWYLCLVTG